jgi:predicted flavoprotein YhiN
VEGGVIYSMSALLRDEIATKGTAALRLDLAPDRDLSGLTNDLAKPRGKKTMATHLERRVGMTGVKVGLLREVVSKEDFADPAKLAAAIKSLPLKLIATRPLAESISSAGGVIFEAVDARLMLREVPGVFCAGEMLDWEAPTGGYLLTACFASGRVAGFGAIEWLSAKAR